MKKIGEHSKKIGENGILKALNNILERMVLGKNLSQNIMHEKEDIYNS